MLHYFHINGEVTYTNMGSTSFKIVKWNNDLFLKQNILQIIRLYYKELNLKLYIMLLTNTTKPINIFPHNR